MFDDEIEKAILYYIIFEKYNFEIAISDFFDEKNKKIAEAIIKLQQSKKSISIISIANTISKENSNKIIQYISEFGNNIYKSNPNELYENLIAMAEKRKCLETLKRNIIKIPDSENIGELIEKTISELNQITKRANTEETFNDKLLKAVEQIEDNYNRRHDLSYYTGLMNLDKITLGLHRKELTIIGARPAVGKTTLALQIAEKIAANGHNVLFVSLEMSDDQIIQKMIARRGNIDMYRIKSGNMEDSDWVKVNESANEINKLPFTIESHIRTIQQLERKAMRIKNKGGLDLIVLDYIQLLKSSSKFNSREQEVADISRRLKLMAVELDIPIIALCQLNRNAAKNEPTTADLRESGSLEQDADNIIFLYKEQEDQEEVDLKLAKQRSGSTGKLRLKFKRNISSFEDKEV